MKKPMSLGDLRAVELDIECRALSYVLLLFLESPAWLSSQEGM